MARLYGQWDYLQLTVKADCRMITLWTFRSA
jgi:hypothetical protein